MTTPNPYQAPASDVTQADDSQSYQPYQPKIFTGQGRIGRLRYLGYGMISYLCLIPVVAVIGVLMALFDDGSGEPGAFSILLIAIAYIALIVFSFMLAKRRLNAKGVGDKRVSFAFRRLLPSLTIVN